MLKSQLLIDGVKNKQKDLLYLELQNLQEVKDLIIVLFVHIDTLRDMTNREDQTGSIMVKLNDPSKAFEVKEFFFIISK